MITATALALAVNIGGAVFNWVFQKVGRVGTQVAIFVLALGAALWYTYQGLVPNIQQYVVAAIGIFSLAVAFYEVLLKYFPMFSGPSNSVLG